ncbi:MAG: shikimate kinase [Pseudomonadota bacterium]
MAAETMAKAQRPALTRPVVLIGLMGAGKSSVGTRLAAMMDAPFRDSDHEIAAVSKMTIPEIFDQFGEAEFRRLERRVIARLLEEEAGVLATGGGAFMQAETRAAIAERAASVWLKADLDVLVSRTEGRTHRPLLNQGNPRDILRDLIDQRYPVYGLADLHVESFMNQTHEEMAERIIEELQGIGAVT